MLRSAQIALPLGEPKSWGGARKPARRRRKKAGIVSHKARPELSHRHPVHVTLRVLPEVPSLRVLNHWVRRALVAGGLKQGFRLVHYSIQSNHLHLIAEADDARRLSRGIQGLAVRIARAVNSAMSRRHGKVFSQRFHQRVLTNPTATKNAIAYLVHNYRKLRAEGDRPVPPHFIDELSSAIHLAGIEESPLPAPRSWLLAIGFRRAGPILIGRFSI